MRLPLLRSLVAAAVSLAALAVLWRFRPAWPELPNSLSSPVTTALLQQLTLIAAWLLSTLVILLLLGQSLRGIGARRRLDLGSAAFYAEPRDSSRLRRPARTQGILRPLVAEPSLLVVAPREATLTPSEEEVVGSSSGTDAGERPLISLLGPLTIYGGKRSRRGLRARALEVIAFLALRREGAQRDEILEALWPGEDPTRSRHRLYQAVRDARRLLGDAVASERDRYWLDRSRVRVDVDELDRVLSEAKKEMGGTRRRLLEQAVRFFRDDPLAGSDYVWSAGIVRRLRGTYVELLEQLGRARLEAADARGALEAAERGLEVDVLNEALWRVALAAEGRLGLREAIAERYETLHQLLDERLGLEPDSSTRTLYRRLLSQA